MHKAKPKAPESVDSTSMSDDQILMDILEEQIIEQELDLIPSFDFSVYNTSK